jgi:hypothetical protein
LKLHLLRFPHTQARIPHARPNVAPVQTRPIRG